MFTLFSVGTPAPQADDLKNHLANPEVLISAIAPDKVRSASPSASITVSEPQNQPLLRSSVAERIDVNISDPETKVDATLGIRDELAFSGLSAGYQVFINEDEKSAAYLKATPNGGQVIFAGANKQAVDDMRISLPIDAGAQLVPALNGGLMIEFQDDIVAIVSQPWARDSAGVELPTSYR